MKNNLFILVPTILLSACQTTGTVMQNENEQLSFDTSTQSSSLNSFTKTDESSCNTEAYARIEGPEFSYIGEDKYIKLYFSVASDSSNYKYKESAYAPLIGAKFKFTGVLAPKEFASQNPYTKVLTVDGSPVEFESNIKSAVVTDSCLAYWFSGHVNYSSITGEYGGVFEKSDKTKVTADDFKFVYGLDNVKPYKAMAKFEIDKFAKTAIITTEYQDSLMLRAWSDSTLTKKPTEIQIYTEISLFDWAHFDRAISDDGEHREVIRIDTDVRNCGGSLGCQVYETVGISVPLDYVKKNKEGFEVQVYGQQKKIIKIPEYQITPMLEAIEQIK